MFNSLKKYAKRVSWTLLRQAQRFAFNAFMIEDARIDARKLMISIGSFSLLKLAMQTTAVHPLERDRFLSYCFYYAEKYVPDLLREFSLPLMPKDSFEDTYRLMLDAYLENESNGDGELSRIAWVVPYYALKPEYQDSETVHYISEKYVDDLLEIFGYINAISAH